MKKRSSRQKGFYYERALARKLWSMGFAVIRGPGSGGGSKEIVQPDLVAVKNGHVIVFEVKVRWKEATIYLTREKIDRLKEFARRADGEPFIAIKIVDKTDWRFIPLDSLEKTRSGNYKITGKILEESLNLNSLIGLVYNSKTITDFIK